MGAKPPVPGVLNDQFLDCLAGGLAAGMGAELTELSAFR